MRLLNRSTRSLALTSAGQDIVHQARKVRELLADTRNIADTYHNEPKGHLRISSATVFGRMYLQPAIEKFMAKYPQITIELILDDRRVDVIGERFDVVFRIGKLQDSNLVAKKSHRMTFHFSPLESLLNFMATQKRRRSSFLYLRLCIPMAA